VLLVSPSATWLIAAIPGRSGRCATHESLNTSEFLESVTVPPRTFLVPAVFRFLLVVLLQLDGQILLPPQA